jgi:hypothetical protein
MTKYAIDLKKVNTWEDFILVLQTLEFTINFAMSPDDPRMSLLRPYAEAIEPLTKPAGSDDVTINDDGSIEAEYTNVE